MSKYVVYHCSITEIDTEENTITPLVEAHLEDNRIHRTKQNAAQELRDILDKHCTQPLCDEVHRLNRVVAVLDRKLADALTISV